MIETNKIYCGDALDVLKTFEDNSIDALVTDPPAGIGFMGKEWDHDKGGRDKWIAWLEEIMVEALRVLKPGGHGFVWALPRTSHWTAFALENAGFEIRDCVYHVFGSGFPKSQDISKAIDKMAGAERNIVGLNQYANKGRTSGIKTNSLGAYSASETDFITTPATPEAKQWDGWGTALKPAVECWWLIRKPIAEKTIAANVLKYDTGGINIDASRIPVDPKVDDMLRSVVRVKRQSKTWENGSGFKNETNQLTGVPSNGRFPANLIHDGSDEVVALFPNQTNGAMTKPYEYKNNGFSMGKATGVTKYIREANEGSAARFFYCAKPSRTERNAGCEEMEKKPLNWSSGEQNPGSFQSENTDRTSQNNHPTVKSIALMQYLIKMITPPDGIVYVCDIFAGSGTTLIAAGKLGFKYIGIEKEPENVTIAEARIKHHLGIFK